MLAAQVQRDGAHGAQVGGHVFAAGAVAAGGALHEHPALVAQADRQAVQLGLGREHQLRPLQLLADATHEVGHLVLAEGIAQRQHRQGVAHFGELRRRGIAHAPGGRIGGGQLRVLGFQRLELAHQAVVLDVRNVGLVEHVVAVVGVVELLAQRGDAVGGRDGGHARIQPAGPAATSVVPWSAVAPRAGGRRRAGPRGCA